MLHRVTLAAGGAVQRSASRGKSSFAPWANIERKIRRVVCAGHYVVKDELNLLIKPRDVTKFAFVSGTAG
jgi:hypothetical protein